MRENENCEEEKIFSNEEFSSIEKILQPRSLFN